MAKTQIEFFRQPDESTDIVLFDLIDDDGAKYLAQVGIEGEVENYVAALETDKDGKVFLRLCSCVDDSIFVTDEGFIKVVLSDD